MTIVMGDVVLIQNVGASTSTGFAKTDEKRITNYATSW